jgi:XisH protein
MARDKFHYNARRALEKDGWTITNDPQHIQAGEVKGEIDLGAEKVFAAEKDGKQIAVEIKSFTSPSPVHDFEEAMDNLGFTDGYYQNKNRPVSYIWQFQSLHTILFFNVHSFRK